MSFRFAIALSAMVAAAGCSADECTKASEHFNQCLGTSPTPTATDDTTTPAPPLRCEMEYLCSSRCVNLSDCDTLKSAFYPDGGTSDAGNKFSECQSKCLSGQ